MARDITFERFALYPWFKEHGADLLHPEDRQRFVDLMPYGKVFAVGQNEEGFTELFYGAEKFRVKPELLKSVSAPRFLVGDTVRIDKGNAIGVVVDVMWHHKDAAPFYLLDVAGRRSSRRYLDSELA